MRLNNFSRMRGWVKYFSRMRGAAGPKSFSRSRWGGGGIANSFLGREVAILFRELEIGGLKSFSRTRRGAKILFSEEG